MMNQHKNINYNNNKRYFYNGARAPNKVVGTLGKRGKSSTLVGCAKCGCRCSSLGLFLRV